jgi:hypothetical protein
MQNKNTPTEGQNSAKLEAESALRDAACSPVFLKLEEFTSGGSKYIRCADDDQRPLLSHILNGAGACFFAEELPKVQMTANAHGWVVHLILENVKSPATAERSFDHE